MAVGIVIPVWNLWETMTFPCLQSLLKHTNPADFHVYLVDNASTDKTASHAEKMGTSLFGREHFTYIRNEQNMGFAIASNQGAEAARNDGHEYILFLNNDTIVTQNWLPPLVKALENPRVGMVGPLLLYPDNTVQHCGVVFNPLKQVGHIYSNFSPTHHNVLKKRKFRVITGAALLCRTRDFFGVGKFHEGYKNGMEDIDLCYCYAEKGLMQQVVPESIVWHHTSQTPGRLDEKSETHNGRLLFERKPDIVLDAHLYYANDGYLPALTKDFVFYPRLEEKKRREFNKTVLSAYSDELCLEYLNKEPFWHDGYQLLIDSLIAQNKIREAVFFCQRAVSYCFSKYHIQRLIDVVSLQDNRHDYDNALQSLRAQHIELGLNRDFYAKKLALHMKNNEWHERLLATQELDTEEFGIY